MLSPTTRHAGFSLVEVLIAMALTGVLAAWGYSAINRLNQAKNFETAKIEAESKLRLLVDGARKQFLARAPGASFVPAASPAFGGGAATSCQGMQITQFSSLANANVTTKYVTDCVSYVSSSGASELNADAKKFPLNGELNCGPGQLPRVTVTQTVATVPPKVTVTQYPPRPQPDWPATVVCFRFQGTDVSIESAMLFAAGTKTGQVAKKMILSTNDHGAGVQYLSP